MSLVLGEPMKGKEVEILDQKIDESSLKKYDGQSQGPEGQR